jgi:PAS domain S-box-containing protein
MRTTPLFESDQLLRTIVDNLCEGIVVVDREGVVLFWSQGAERITGYTSAEVVGGNSTGGVLDSGEGAGEALPSAICPLAQTLVDGVPRERAVVMRHKDGHPVPVCVRPVALRGEGGEILGALESIVEVFPPPRGHSSGPSH